MQTAFGNEKILIVEETLSRIGEKLFPIFRRLVDFPRNKIDISI